MSAWPGLLGIALAACVPRPEHYLETCDSGTACANPDLECAYRPYWFTAVPPGADGVPIPGDTWLCSLPCERDADCPEVNCDVGYGDGDGAFGANCAPDGYCFVDCYE